MRQAWVVALFAIQVPFVAYAPHVRSENVGRADPLDWLQRIYTATKKLSYSGVFIYQHGTQSETSRISRFVPPVGSTQERVEALDGSPTVFRVVLSISLCSRSFTSSNPRVSGVE